MVTRIGGIKRKSRHKLTKPMRARGKISVSKYMQKFKEGDQVLLHAEPAVQSGMYPPKYHGKVGKIRSSRGQCYEVTIKDFKLEKTFIVHPVHLRALKGVK